MRPIGTDIPDEVDARFRAEVTSLISEEGRRPKLSIAITAAILCILDAPKAEKMRYLKAAALAKLEDEIDG